MNALEELKITFKEIIPIDDIIKEARHIYYSSMKLVKSSRYYPPTMEDIAANIIIEKLKMQTLQSADSFEEKNKVLFELGTLSSAEELIEWYKHLNE